MTKHLYSFFNESKTHINSIYVILAVPVAATPQIQVKKKSE